MAYFFIIFSTVLFGVQFGFTKKFQTLAGEGIKSSFLYNAVSPVVFGIIMFIIVRDKLDFLPFTVVCSLVWAAIKTTLSICCDICSMINAQEN